MVKSKFLSIEQNQLRDMWLCNEHISEIQALAIKNLGYGIKRYRTFEGFVKTNGYKVDNKLIDEMVRLAKERKMKSVFKQSSK